jgi:hypothetical protein
VKHEAEEDWGAKALRAMRETVIVAITGALIVILTMGVAFAQNDLRDVQGGENSLRTEQEKKNDRDIDRAYHSAVRRLPDKEKKQSDPWGDVRPTPPAAAAKHTRNNAPRRFPPLAVRPLSGLLLVLAE